MYVGVWLDFHALSRHTAAAATPAAFVLSVIKCTSNLRFITATYTQGFFSKRKVLEFAKPDFKSDEGELAMPETSRARLKVFLNETELLFSRVLKAKQL